MDVREMKSGKELDTEVAEKAMGWKIGVDPAEDGGKSWFVESNGGDWVETGYYPDNFKPSTDIKQAWEMAEKMGIPFLICKSYEHQFEVGELGWVVHWCKESGCDIGYRCEHGNDVWSLSAPEAICKAALMALEDKA